MHACVWDMGAAAGVGPGLRALRVLGGSS